MRIPHKTEHKCCNQIVLKLHFCSAQMSILEQKLNFTHKAIGSNFTHKTIGSNLHIKLLDMSSSTLNYQYIYKFLSLL